MSADVLTLPTQRAVEDAYERWAAEYRRIEREPNLRFDGQFMADVNDLRNEWLALFSAWSKVAA